MTFEAEIREIKEQGLWRSLREIQGPPGPRVRIRGRELVCMASNDYLGLATHPLLKEAAVRAVEAWGTSAAASRLLVGNSALHREVEERAAALLQSQAALWFGSGYAANTGVIPALAQAGDLILSDSLNHASIVDGCRLSRADKIVYNHLDINELEAYLKKSHQYRRRWIVTESLFSMDGDLAPLPEIVELAERHGAGVYVDEAHAVGTLGERGGGWAQACGVAERITLRLATLGKALGSYGAVVAGPRSLVDLLVNRARSLIYSTAAAPAVLAASAAALDLASGATGARLRGRLQENVRRLASAVERAGWPARPGPSPIFPLVLGPVDRAVEAAAALEARGVLAPAVRPPTVPPGTARIRLSVSAAHAPEDLAAAAAALAAVGPGAGRPA